MELHIEYLRGIPEIQGLKLEEIVPVRIIFDERQARKCSYVVAVSQYCTSIVRATIRYRLDRPFVLPDSKDLIGYPTIQVSQLPLILHFKWLLLLANLIISHEIMLISCLLGLKLCD
jgi:hypothetical protein